jgi:glycosyltransferase involved in cell wall biosynthesis
MSSRPICVVTVCLNPGLLLRDAIASTRALQDARIRHLVVDGGSTDGTVEWLRAQGPSVQWISEPDSGIYSAMNKGWQMCPADAYVLFLGADDRLLKVPSESELDALERDGIGMVFGSTQVGDRLFRSRFDAGIRWRNTLHHQSLMVRKSLSMNPPFDERLRVYADWDFNLRLWLSGTKAGKSDGLLAFASPGGASWRRPFGETFEVARRHGTWLAGLVAVAFALAGRLRLAARNHRESLSMKRTAP